MQRAASVQIETVAEFKAHVKALLKESQLQAAMRFAGIKFESAPFQSLQLQEEVALVHWWVKAYAVGSDLKTLATKCLVKVNTLINKIQTSAVSSFKQADGLGELSALEVDQCLAELLYTKRRIETLIQFNDAEQSLKVMEDSLMSKEEAQNDFLVAKYYVKTLQLFDKF